MSKVSPEPISPTPHKRHHNHAKLTEEQVQERVEVEFAKKEKELKETVEKETEARVRKQITKALEDEWKEKYDVEVEKNETWVVRIKEADDRTQRAEMKLFHYEEAADALATDNAKKLAKSESEKQTFENQVKELNTLVQELRETERACNSRISNLETQLSKQTSRAETLEQSYAAEVEKTEKLNNNYRQKVESLSSELEEKTKRLAAEVEKHKVLHQENQEKMSGQQRGESSKLLFLFVSARMKRAVVISFAKWKIYNLSHNNLEKHSDMINNHNDQLVTLRKDKEEELMKSNVQAAQLRLNYEAIIRDLRTELEQMESTIVRMTKPSSSSPVFNRALALERCDFGNDTKRSEYGQKAKPKKKA